MPDQPVRIDRTPDYTPEQLLRFHAVCLLNRTFQLVDIAARDPVAAHVLQDPLRKILESYTTAEGVTLTGYNTDASHNRTLDQAVTDALKDVARIPAHPTSRLLLRLCLQCIHHICQILRVQDEEDQTAAEPAREASRTLARALRNTTFEL